MKKYLALLLFAFIATLSFGQSNYQDVVYLKNGSIIRGIIIEQIPNKSIKIETADKNVFVYKMDEIEKITKETPIKQKQTDDPERRKGYIGLSLGPSIPVDVFASTKNGGAQTGLQLNLVNFGYLFSKHVGIAASWFGASNPVVFDGIDPWSYGGLLGGPLISFPLSESEKVECDFRPMIGYSVTTLPDIGDGTEQASSFAFNIGTTFRINVWKKVSFLLSADFFSTKAVFKDYELFQNIRTISFGFGAAYRLR